MRVALFTNTYPPSLNGVANVTHFYRLGLTERGHDVHVFAPAPQGEDPFEDDPAVHRYRSVRIPGEVDYMMALPPVFCPRLGKVIEEIDFDLVHTQHPIWVGTWGQSLARRRRIPVVSTAHTQYELYANRSVLPTEWIEPAVTRHVVQYFNRCHVVTTPVRWMRELLIERGVASPLELVPNPVDLSSLGEPNRSATRAKLGLSEDDVVVGYLGRLSPVKRVPLLIDAVVKLSERHPDVKLVVVGGGGNGNALRQRARKRLGNRAIFTGSVPYNEVEHYHAAFDVFATASKSETQPLAYTEAMYVGTPVVALATPGAVDMIRDGENGLLVPAEAGAAGLAEAVERVLGDPELAERLRRGGRRFARARHYTAVAKRLEDIYALAADRNAAGW
ncbi:MAG: glycosyltransferase [Armatimonadota bacterium]|jgi:1,2-diacylglycerol 3-alpha-glucosyltransferase